MRKALVAAAAALVLTAAYGTPAMGRTSAMSPPSPAPGDTYAGYADLSAHETEGADYRITERRPATATTAQIAIHGGAIEPGTTQLADHAASIRGDAYYSFEGIKPSANGTLHLTSTHFDEPRAVDLVGASTSTVSWHGAAGTTAKTYIGGRDTELKSAAADQLRAAGFTVATGTPPELNANSPANITNRNGRGQGLQLELTKAQRTLFFTDGKLDRAWIEDPAHRTAAFYAYTAAIDRALADRRP